MSVNALRVEEAVEGTYVMAARPSRPMVSCLNILNAEWDVGCDVIGDCGGVSNCVFGVDGSWNECMCMWRVEVVEERRLLERQKGGNT